MIPAYRCTNSAQAAASVGHTNSRRIRSVERPGGTGSLMSSYSPASEKKTLHLPALTTSSQPFLTRERHCPSSGPCPPALKNRFPIGPPCPILSPAPVSEDGRAPAR